MLSGIFVVFVRKYECEYLALFIRLTSNTRLFIAKIMVSIPVFDTMNNFDIIIEFDSDT